MLVEVGDGLRLRFAKTLRALLRDHFAVLHFAEQILHLDQLINQWFNFAIKTNREGFERVAGAPNRLAQVVMRFGMRARFQSAPRAL